MDDRRRNYNAETFPTRRRGGRPRPTLRWLMDLFHAPTSPLRRRGGLPRPPGTGQRSTSVRPCEMVRGLCPRDWIRWVVDAGRARRDKRGQNRPSLTDASNPPRQSSGARGVEDAAPYGGCETKVAAYDVMCATPSRLPMVRGLRPRVCIRWVVDERLAHRGKRGCNRPCQTDASNPPRQSREHGASGTPPLTGSSETKLAA